jgi:hypothetical protein
MPTSISRPLPWGRRTHRTEQVTRAPTCRKQLCPISTPASESDHLQPRAHTQKAMNKSTGTKAPRRLRRRLLTGTHQTSHISMNSLAMAEVSTSASGCLTCLEWGGPRESGRKKEVKTIGVYRIPLAALHPGAGNPQWFLSSLPQTLHYYQG